MKFCFTLINVKYIFLSSLNKKITDIEKNKIGSFSLNFTPNRGKTAHRTSDFEGKC